MRNKFLFGLVLNLLNVLPGYGKALAIRGRFIAKRVLCCGANLKVSSMVNIYNPGNLSIGQNVYICYSTYIGGGKVFLDDEVIIGPFCSIVAGNHTKQEGSYRFGAYDFGEITIGRGTWLCSHVTVTSNTKIGSGCLIAAGSVVTKDIPDNCVAAGVQAKIIKKN